MYIYIYIHILRVALELGAETGPAVSQPSGRDRNNHELHKQK